ncbi:HET-domain-containing protein [Apiospora arundinis]
MPPGTPETLKEARGWMNDCIANHPKCGQGGSTGLPARLVQISPPGEPAWARVRESTGEYGQYCALSYCWGRDQEHKTLISCYGQYKKALPYSKLSKTITDAFHVARSMGMMYIWVDSLCIVQDDRQDKEREMSQMMSIYQKAHFTISAASASDATEGFLRAPSELGGISHLGPYYHPLQVSEDQIGSVVITPARRGHEPVNKRGWSLQESLLTPRLLVFTDHMTVWKCHAGFQPKHYMPLNRHHFEPSYETNKWDRWYEASGYIMNTQGVLITEEDQSPVLNAPITEEFPHSTQGLIHSSFWHSIVNQYTKRNLSENRDRLPAISAIAQALSPLFQCSYYAGLWDRDLVSGLAWHVEHLSRLPSSKSAAGPSWSWATVVGRSCVHIDTQPFTIRAEVISCKTTPVSETNPYGEVAGGELVIRGHLQQVRVVRRTAIVGCMFDEFGQKYEGSCFHDDEIFSTPQDPVAVRRYDGEQGLMEDAWCLALVDSAQNASGDSETDFNTVAMIVIVKVDEGKGPFYKRVGFAWAEVQQAPYWWEASGRKIVTII